VHKRKKRHRREAKQLGIILDKLGIPFLPWGTTDRYFKQIEDDAIRLADEIWDRGTAISWQCGESTNSKRNDQFQGQLRR
jgi:hypothetical protein